MNGLVISVSNAHRCRHLRPISTPAEFARAEKAASICPDMAGATLTARRRRFHSDTKDGQMYVFRPRCGGETQRPKKEHGIGPNDPRLRPRDVTSCNTVCSCCRAIADQCGAASLCVPD
jgi:hypothetical protein